MAEPSKPDNLPFPPAPEQRSGLISLDIPWHFVTRGGPPKDPATDRSYQSHYPTISLDYAQQIPVRQYALDDCHVMLWITGPLLVTGIHLKLFDAWGVEVSSMGFVWLKLWNNTDMSQYARTPLLEQDIAMGGGYTTRQNVEYVVFGRIGKPARARADIRQVIVSPRREHSRKPDEFYRRAYHYCDTTRLDMFPGRARKGWQSWGWGHREGDLPGYPGDEMMGGDIL